MTAATDVYRLGAILYALITGRALFDADSPAETSRRSVTGRPNPSRSAIPGSRTTWSSSS